MYYFYALVAAFGGGIIGAYMGALPAFILTGVVALIGGIVSLAGAPDLAVGFIAFGSYLGPHIAFAGGVAAAAYAGKTKKLSSGGTDILSSLNGLQDPMTLLVGGVFGVIGFGLCYLFGDVLKLNTDLPALTVIVSAIIARFAFGTTGLLGKTPEGESKVYLSSGKSLVCTIILGLGVSTAVSFVYTAMVTSGIDQGLLGIFPVVCFGISATSLIFAQTGFSTPATHHISLIAGVAVVLTGNPIIGVVFGIISAILCDFFANTFNTNSDTHIDPPAFAIFTLTFVLNLLFGSGLLLV